MSFSDPSSLDNNNITSNINSLPSNLSLPSSTSSLSNLSTLNGLKGISSLIVLIGNYYLLFSPLYNSEFNILIEYSSLSTLFIIISGFILVHIYYPINNNNNNNIDIELQNIENSNGFIQLPLSDTSNNSTSSILTPFSSNSSILLFLYKRIIRLAPLYYIGILLGILPLFIYFNIYDSIKILFINILCIQSLYPLIYINPPLWTVSVLLICYILFPYIFNFLINQEEEFIINLTYLMQGISMSFALTILIYFKDYLIVSHFFILFRIPQFIIGICFGIIAKSSENFFENEVSMVDTCTLAVMFVFFACPTIASNYVGEKRIEVYLVFSYLAEFSIAWLYGYWIAYLTRDKDNESYSATFLNLPHVQDMGDYSYSMYCIHFPLLIFFSWVNAGGISSDLLPLRQWYYNIPGFWNFEYWAIVPIGSLLVILSAAFYLYIEEPLRKYFK